MQKQVVAVIAIIVVVAIIGAVSLGYPYKSLAPTSMLTSTIYTTSLVPKQVLMPYPIQACAHPDIDLYSGIFNSTGLTMFNLSGINDYVITPGNTGTINYIIHVASYGQNFKVPVNNTAFTELYNATTTNSELINVSSSAGVSLSYSPANEVIMSNSLAENISIPVAASISIAFNAPAATYWAILSPGQCFGGPQPFLLTVGNTPFNGSISSYVATP